MRLLSLSARKAVVLFDERAKANIFLQFAIYMATIDYMIASYGPYSASATGGNALARDFLAGVAAMYSVPCKPLSLSTLHLGAQEKDAD